MLLTGRRRSQGPISGMWKEIFSLLRTSTQADSLSLGNVAGAQVFMTFLHLVFILRIPSSVCLHVFVSNTEICSREYFIIVYI